MDEMASRNDLLKEIGIIEETCAMLDAKIVEAKSRQSELEKIEDAAAAMDFANKITDFTRQAEEMKVQLAEFKRSIEQDEIKVTKSSFPLIKLQLYDKERQLSKVLGQADKLNADMEIKRIQEDKLNADMEIKRIEAKLQEELEKNESTKKKEVRLQAVISRSLNDAQPKEYKDLLPYVALGRELAGSKETKNIVELINKIQSEETLFESMKGCYEVRLKEERYLPQFIFVCASSGTGKTQMAFSLKIPLLYFPLNMGLNKKPSMRFNKKGSFRSQRIYKSYENAAACIVECARKDVKFLMDVASKSSKEDERYELNIDSMGHELLLPGLICAMCEGILDQSSNEPWILAQLRIDAVAKPISLYNASISLKRLFGEKSLPVIIFDECQKDPADADFEMRYLYLRRCIRMLGLVCVFMGTNTSLANYITFDKGRGSRGERGPVYDILWCFIVHTLAPTSKVFVDKKRAELKELASAKGLGKCVQELVDVVVQAMENERPLFAHMMFAMLHEEIQQLTDADFDARSILSRISGRLIADFAQRKYDIDMFDESEVKCYNMCNLSLISPEFYKKASAEKAKTPEKKNKKAKTQEKGKEARMSEKERTAGVNMHIANLHIPESVKEMMSSTLYNCCGISILSSDLVFSGTIHSNGEDEYTGILFQQFQEFKSFDQEPFSQSGYLAPQNFKNIFVKQIAGTGSNAKVSRLSAMSAVSKLLEEYGIPIVNKKSGWCCFELAVAVGALIATQTGGYAGTSFAEWMRHFVRELRSREYGELPDVVLPSCIENIQIPMCTASISAEWNSALQSYLHGSAYLGVVHALLQTDPRDICIADTDGREIVAIECKTTGQDEMQMQRIREGITQLTRKCSELNIKPEIRLLVCNKMPKNMKMVQNSNTYLLVKQKTGYEFRPVYTDQDTDGKLILMIDTEKI